MKTKNATHYRQGDVLLRYVDSLPAKLNPVIRQRGRLILANGASGHDHYIEDPTAEMGTAADGGQFLTLKGEKLKGRFPIKERTKLHVLAILPSLGEVAFAAADVKTSGKSVVVDGYFTPLHHNAKPIEHHTQMLPRGFAEQIDQSEFNREEIRRVQD